MLGSYLHRQQFETLKYKEYVSKAPVGGFHKFASDVEWMMFIQYMGGLKSVNKDNVDEVIDRIEKIVSYDPNFEKAYQVGVMSLSVASPEQAVRLLEKACKNPQLKNNWKLPFYAGFILTHTAQNAKIPEEEKLEKVKRAIGFYEMAIKRSSSPETYVVNSFLRARAKAMGLENEKLAMLKVLRSEWKKTSGAREIEISIIPELKNRILKAAQEARRETPNDKKIIQLTDSIMGEIFKDRHICPSCLNAYGPGDKFCSNCGTKVAVFGVCGKCGAVLKGKFCSKCGSPAKKQKVSKKKGPSPAVSPKKAPSKKNKSAK
jgi:hypothetical protein